MAKEWRREVRGDDHGRRRRSKFGSWRALGEMGVQKEWMKVRSEGGS